MTEAKAVHYNSTNRAKYYDAQKKNRMPYTEKKIVTYTGNPESSKETESSNGKKFYREDEDKDEDVIMLADATNGFSTSSIKMWMVDKKKGEYYEIDMSDFPMNPGDIMNPGTGSTVTETLKGYYKIGSNNYPAECFVSTTTFAGGTFKSAEIYCYNGGHYPVYIVDLEQGYDTDKEGNPITVMEEFRTTKVDFQAKADASLMDFNSILKKYKDGGKKSWSELSGQALNLQ